MGGDIHVDSTPGVGSTFWFDLPVARTAWSASPSRSARPRRSPAPATISALRRGSSSRIAVARGASPLRRRQLRVSRGSVEVVVTLRAPVARGRREPATARLPRSRCARAACSSPRRRRSRYLAAPRSRADAVARAHRARDSRRVRPLALRRHAERPRRRRPAADRSPARARARASRRSGRARRTTRALDRTPQLIGAPVVWGPTLANAGQGMKIGIIDEGVDQTHPFFSPAGFTMPAGFPKGNTAFTTAKVIVARAFAPPSPKWKYATLPFDPEDTRARHARRGHRRGRPRHARRRSSRRSRCPGIAPAAYIGNYKALTVPTAVLRSRRQRARDREGDRAGGRGRDGRDQPVARRAGDRAVARHRRQGDRRRRRRRRRPVHRRRQRGRRRGKGSVGSPGERAARDHRRRVHDGSRRPGRRDRRLLVDRADAVLAAAQAGRDRAGRQHPLVAAASRAGRSSAARAWPRRTSPARPRCSSSAHPTWTVAQIKSALDADGRSRLHERRAHGRGDARCAQAAAASTSRARTNPLVFAAPSSVSFGLMKPRHEQDDLDRADRRRRRRRRRGRSSLTHAAGEHAVRARLGHGAGHARRRRRRSPRARTRATGPGFVTLRRGTDVRADPVLAPRRAPAARQADDDR